jgi:methylmalonyl-CoA mutase N-terminal domain/subunit
VQTAGSSLQATEVDLNVVRVAMQALAAVLGGCQSLHTNSRDEALGLPSEEAALLALRTQQLLAHETGVGATVDPLGGSYAVEWLTGRIEAETTELLDRIDAMGGALRAIEAGFIQRAIEDSAYRHQCEVEAGKRLVVGVNAFRRGQPAAAIPAFRVDPALETAQRRSLEDVRKQRDEQQVQGALTRLETAARESGELMPSVIEAVEAYASVGEITDRLRAVFGEYTPA